MKIIKRSGAEVDFDPKKIEIAVKKANESVVPSERMSDIQIKRIAEDVESAATNVNRSLSVEEIQDMVEDQIMNQRAFDVARRYITYRYQRALVRKANTTDEQILSLIECNNEEVKQENSNKNPTVNSVQRDYMAGEVSKDITKRLLPKGMFTYETIRGKKIADTSLTADWEKQLAGLESGMITGQDFLNRIRTLAKEMTDDIFNTYSTKEE